MECKVHPYLFSSELTQELRALKLRASCAVSSVIANGYLSVSSLLKSSQIYYL